jgi:hypothetical protein
MGTGLLVNTVCWTIFAIAGARADATAQAERLAALRSEVETLNDAVQADKDELRGELRALEAQKVDLEVQLRRQELRLERLLDEEASLRAKIRDGGDGSGELAAAVQRGIAELRATVETGLPFKQEDRLAALDELARQLDESALPVEQLAARLWAFAEDERRLRRENVLERQLAVIDGEETLVDVARLGMIGMYWRSPDGSLGQVRRTSSGWEWAVLDDSRARTQVDALFGALERGIRTGWFPLPEPLQAVVEVR